MTINHEKKLIFINIPKNAGTSIIMSMGIEDVHTDTNVYMDKNISDYKTHYYEYWNKYKKFSVVRNPIDRFISAYKFSRMKESEWFSSTGKNGLRKHDHYDLCNKMDINDYIEFLYKNPKKFNLWLIPQSWFFMSKDRNKNNFTEIDYFIRYENLIEDLKKVKIYNIKKINNSKIEDDSLIQLSKKSLNLLHIIYEIDFINFEYKKSNLFNFY